ncbi:MAG: FAD binding domain-containing protein, partial [bacterium]
VRPKDLKETSRFLEKGGQESMLCAGGTDVLGLMKNAVVAPQKLVNLKSIPELNAIKYTPGKGLKIGALVTIAEIVEHPIIVEKYPILQQAAQEVASPQLRNVGTLGGNICQRPRCWYFRGEFDCLRKGGELCYAVDGQNKYHCIVGGGPCYIVHPSDMAVALLALDAKNYIFKGKKSRTVLLSEFFVLPEQDVLHENILQPGEIVTELQIPELKANVKSGFVKFKERGAWDFAVVSVAGVIEKNGHVIQSGRIAFGGVAPAPWQEPTINQKLQGMSISKDSFSALAQSSFKNAEPRSMNAYKVPLARNLMQRLLTELVA